MGSPSAKKPATKTKTQASTTKNESTKRRKTGAAAKDEVAAKDATVATKDASVAVENTPLPTVAEPETDPAVAGAYDATAGEWIVNLENNLRLRVTRFKGNTYVDLRKMWQGNPTQKGVMVSVETFKKIQEWNHLGEAISAVEKGK